MLVIHPASATVYVRGGNGTYKGANKNACLVSVALWRGGVPTTHVKTRTVLY